MRKKTINANERQRHQSACGDASLTVTHRVGARLRSQIATHTTGAPQARRHAGGIIKASTGIGSVWHSLSERARCPRFLRIFPKTQKLISVSAGERTTVGELQ